MGERGRRGKIASNVDFDFDRLDIPCSFDFSRRIRSLAHLGTLTSSPGRTSPTHVRLIFKTLSHILMNTDPYPLKRSGDIAFAANVLIAYLSALLLSPHLFTQPTGMLLLVLGAGYLLIGTYGFSVFLRTGLPLLGYFGIEILLGAAILYLSRYVGAMWLILLPLAGYSVALPRPWMLSVCALIVLAFGVPMGLLFGWGEAAISSIAFLAGIVFVVIFVQLTLREQNARIQMERLAAELTEANRKLREYATQAEELAIARERNRLAREIHDSLGHYLTVIHVQIAAARAVMENDQARALDALDKARSLVHESLAEVRRSVAALRASPTENRPLPEAIAVLVEECRATGILTELAVCGEPRQLSPQVELTLYRVVQEGLTNVRKHAHASRAEVTLDYREPGAVCLAVGDNGLGSDNTDGGFGLPGLRERVSLLGGDVRIVTAPARGFMLEVRLPAEPGRQAKEQT